MGVVPSFLGASPELVSSLVWTAPISITLALIIARAAPGIMERWNERRRIRAEEMAADWTRLRDEINRLSAAKQAVEAENHDLKKDLEQTEDGRLHWMERAIVAESKLQGRGEVREAKAIAAAEVRLAAKQENGGDGP